MDDGISAIILIIITLLLSLFFFVLLIEELSIGFFLISLVLIPLLIYTSLLVLTFKYDKYRTQKEWELLEKMEKMQPPIITSLLEEQKYDK